MASLAVVLRTFSVLVVHGPTTVEEIGWTPIRLRVKRFGLSGGRYQIQRV